MLKKIFIIFLVNAFVLNCGILNAGELLSLDSLIKEARESNPEILAAKKRLEASLVRVPIAKSWDAPQVGLTFEKIPSGSLKFNKTMSEDRMLSISGAFPLFGKLNLKGKIALIESQMFAADYKNKELEIINQVKNNYYDLFMNYKETELNEESLLLLENVAKTLEARYIVGEISQEEVFKINLEIARLGNNIANLKAEKLAKETRINSLLNREPQSLLEEPQLKEDATFNQDLNALYRLTLINQPELLIFSYAIEKNKYAESLAQRSFFPDLMAELVQRGITSGSFGPWDITLAFTLPFWFWTKQRYEVKEAIANLDEARASYVAMKNKALSETKDLYTRIEIAKNKINLYKTNEMPLLESSIKSSLAAFGAGKGDFIMLLDNERMLIEIKMNYYKALVEYNTALSDLERTVGMDLYSAS